LAELIKTDPSNFGATHGYAGNVRHENAEQEKSAFKLELASRCRY